MGDAGRHEKKDSRLISRILYPPEADFYHLSGPAITSGIKQPTHSNLIE